MSIGDLLGIDNDVVVTGICDDSRDVQEGFLFVATKGYHVDHYDYINDAIENGCVFLIVDREIPFSFPHLIVDNINNLYKELCKKFYGVDLEKFHFIGITGTDGKTSVASMVKELIKDCAYVGTNGLIVGNEEISTGNTTPCPTELYKDFKKIQDKNVSTISMEVSSEALLHERVSNLTYDIVGFTNITGDHLNVHKTFDEYANCKMKLLDLVKKNGIVIVNGDDEYLSNIHCKNLYTFGFNKTNDYVISDVKNLSNFVKITVKSKDNIYELKSPFKEMFNIYNVVMAFLIALFFGIDESLLLKRVQGLLPIKGRCEKLDFGQDYPIILDYAHTIHGIKSILDAYQNYSPIIVVTGAAGGREKEKRPIIGDIILKKSDIAIFTMDDPRYERVDDIIDEMVGNHQNYIRILDRREAIYYALEVAKKGSVVLILGKGRDSYMAIDDKKVPYSDYDVIQSYFKNRG